MAPGRRPDRYVGLISGTSMDGIDAAVADFSGATPKVLAADTYAFSADIARRLEQLRRDPDHLPAAELARLDALLGKALARAALAIIAAAGCRPEDIAAIGSHGQTVLHRPFDDPPHTLQVGDPHRVARETGRTVVADFRRADLAAGGQGAPLAPLLHDAALRRAGVRRAVVNLGGIANLTVLADDVPLSGFDTGPANCLLDEWYRRHRDGRFDREGRWATTGRVDRAWLDRLVDDPYFARPAPKSTGIEYFGAHWLEEHLPAWAQERPADVQATLAELTATTIADALLRQGPDSPDEVLVCGGGVHNRDLIARLQRKLDDVRVESTAGHGIDPDHVESLLFAWLASRRLQELRVDTRTITGASTPVLAGTIHQP